MVGIIYWVVYQDFRLCYEDSGCGIRVALGGVFISWQNLWSDQVLYRISHF